jgi:hypothetical protein
VFGFAFAVNSSVHSYLVLAYAGSEKAAEDVGFYYAANALGRFFGTLMSGLLYQWGGLLARWPGSAVMLPLCWEKAAVSVTMGLFERYLTVWVGLGILAGVGLGLWLPGLFQAIAGLEIAHVNLVVAVFIWVMIYPMMIQIDLACGQGRRQAPAGCC